MPLTLLGPMDFSIKFGLVKSGWSNIYCGVTAGLNSSAGPKGGPGGHVPLEEAVRALKNLNHA